MTVFDVVINFLETALMVVFCYSISDHHCKKNILISILFIIVDSLWITYSNTLYIFEGYLFLVDVAMFFVYLTMVSSFSTAQKLAVTLFDNTIIYIINSLTVVIFSMLLYHCIDYSTLVIEHHISLFIFTKILLAAVLYFVSKYIRTHNFFLDSHDYWYIVVLLLLSNCVFTALSNIIYNETLNQVYLVIALFGIVLFTVMIIWFTVQLNLKNHDTLRSEYDNALLSAKLSDQNKLLESQEELHKIRHDLKHLLTLCNSADSFERDQELNEIANLYQSKVDQVFLPIQSNDPVIDRVLNIKGKEAAAKNISLTCQLNYTHPAAIEKTDLELVLSNLIDNAIEHIGLERHITVAIGIVHSSFQIRIINSIDHSVLDSDHHFKPSASSSEHGYGVDTIEQIVKEYHGSLYYCEDGFNLTAQVLLPDDEHYMSEKGKQEKDRQKPNSAGDHQ